ncbi:MAG: response regulator [Deltaproteobacteria bacterium]|nr:response regulator [Deltaproteobacteria bacterium]
MPTPSAERTNAKNHHPALIMAVDDDPFTLESFSRFLEKQGYQVLTADNGAAALILCQQRKPDIIMMDATMPGLDGFQTCRKIKENSALNDIPIIMVTGLEDADSVSKAFASGAEEYITKPVNWAVLEQRLKLLLAHRKAEKDLLEYAANLAKSNHDLEAFAYIVSHDLKEPLNLIQAFAQRLEKKCGAQLGENGHEYLRRINHSAGHMQQLIDGLLYYARITTTKEPFSSVPLGALIENIVKDLELELSKLEARVKIGELPTLEADPILIEQLFRNLFSNALKYRSEKRPLLISISASPLSEHNGTEEKKWEIVIQDNGLGFDNRDQEKIFAMFQRLDQGKKLPGSGIGLAICRRIAEQHQGSIRASSVVDQGSSFYLVLPEKQKP